MENIESTTTNNDKDNIKIKPADSQENKNPKENQTQYKVINVDNIDGSTFKTKRKSFISEINPHLVRRTIQKEQYVWFGVYDDLLRKKCIIKAIKKCKDASLPLECAAIHLENYKVSFRKKDSNNTKIYMFEAPKSVMFLKLYLITKNQLYDMLNLHYGIEMQNGEEQLFKELQTINSLVSLNNNEYDYLKCVGDLDNILIYSLINKEKKEFSISSPPIDYLRNIFIGMKKSFHPYSRYLIIYYLYRLEGIKNFYDINQLTECFFNYSNKDPFGFNTNNTFSSNTDSKFSSNEKNLMVISEEKENNTITLNETNSPNRKDNDNETVKCSTCNGYPYMGTPEKDQLNQYSYIFDLHHLPIFDENTGEFFWSNNEANWKSARDSILKSEELNGKSLSLNHGSIYSLSNSFINNQNVQNSKDDEADKRWNEFKKEGNSNTFINDLSNLLRNFENDN